MVQSTKVTAVAAIKEQFENSTAAIVTEYRGLSVPAMTELRRALGKSATYSVAKNTLVKRAAAEVGVEGLEDLLVGPTAIAFIDGEPVEAAKARDVLLAKLAGAMKGNLAKAAGLFNAPASQVARLAAALQEKKSAE